MPNAQVSSPVVLQSVELAAVAISGSATDLTTGILPNARLSEVPNSALEDSSVTVAGHAIPLGGSQNLAASDLTNGTTGSGSVVLATAPGLTDVDIAGGTITGMPTPVNPTDVANKSYVDSVASGLSVHTAVAGATTSALPNSPAYSNGSSGVGATLTASSNGALTVDGYAVQTNDRLLIKNEATGANNGVYVATNPGSGGTPYVLTRATDFDDALNITPDSYFFVENGSVNAASGWLMTTSEPITVGTTSIVFTQFSASSAYLAGMGLTLTGNTFSLTNSSVTIAGHTVDLGGSQTLAAADLTNGTTGSGEIALQTSPTLASLATTGNTNLGGPLIQGISLTGATQAAFAFDTSGGGSVSGLNGAWYFSIEESFTPGSGVFFTCMNIQDIMQSGGNGQRVAFNVNFSTGFGGAGQFYTGAQLNAVCTGGEGLFVGANPTVTIGSGAVGAGVNAGAMEADVLIQCATVVDKIGIQIADLPGSVGTGTSRDAALLIEANLSSAVGFENGILIGATSGGVKASGTLFNTGSGRTYATGINLQNATFTTGAFFSNGCSIDGSGNGNFKTVAAQYNALGPSLRAGYGTFAVSTLPGIGIVNGAGNLSFFEASDGTHSWIGGVDGGTGIVKMGTLSNHPLVIVADNTAALTIAASGAIEFNSAASFTANGTTSVSFGSTAPSGAHATPQEWLTITNNNGITRYIACF